MRDATHRCTLDYMYLILSVYSRNVVLPLFPRPLPEVATCNGCVPDLYDLGQGVMDEHILLLVLNIGNMETRIRLAAGKTDKLLWDFGNNIGCKNINMNSK